MTTDAQIRSTGSYPFLWIVNLILALIGLGDSIYLTFVKIGSSTPAFCAPGGGCDVVNSSPYSEIFGIPIAILGAGAYLVLFVALLLERRSDEWKSNSLLLQLGVSLIGLVYSAYLTYLEIAVIKAICPYCVVSAVVITLYFLITVYRLVKFQTDYDNLE
jgi:uncharacterized membrane protein